MKTLVTQDKQKEIAFFDWYAENEEYDVFTPQSNQRLIKAVLRLLALSRGARIAEAIDNATGAAESTVVEVMITYRILRIQAAFWYGTLALYRRTPSCKHALRAHLPRLS